MLNFLNDQPTKQATDAERAFLGLIEGGCQVPIGVHAVTEGDAVSIEESSHLWTEALFYAIRSEARL